MEEEEEEEDDDDDDDDDEIFMHWDLTYMEKVSMPTAKKMEQKSKRCSVW